VVLVHPGDRGLQLLIAGRSRRRLPALGVVVSGGGDRAAVLAQHGADRLDTPAQPARTHAAGLVLVDEPHERCCGRSSPAAKKTDAALRISLARRSSAFSRFSRLISACSSLVSPGRVPASTSAWRTHLRSVSAVPMPSFSATAQIAGQSDGYSGRTSATI